MRIELLDLIVCPDCQAPLDVVDPSMRGGEVQSGDLVSRGGGHRFRIRDYIPRFIDDGANADAFSLEWNTFRTAHLKRFTQLSYLEEQFNEFIDFPAERLNGKLVLDAGCGLGRFSEVVLDKGGSVVAVDLSYAIDAARENLHDREGIHFIQADIFRLPFRDGSFDFVYSWGVLHHTPDPPEAFRQLPPLVRPGGKLMIFVYAKYNKAYLATTNFYRRLTTRLPPTPIAEAVIHRPAALPRLLDTRSRAVHHPHPPTGKRPAPDAWLASGNTFDLYSPKYALACEHVEVYGWVEKAGLEAIRPVGAESGVSYIATKPSVDPARW